MFNVARLEKCWGHPFSSPPLFFMYMMCGNQRKAIRVDLLVSFNKSMVSQLCISILTGTYHIQPLFFLQNITKFVFCLLIVYNLIIGFPGAAGVIPRFKKMGYWSDI